MDQLIDFINPALYYNRCVGAPGVVHSLGAPKLLSPSLTIQTQSSNWLWHSTKNIYVGHEDEKEIFSI